MLSFLPNLEDTVGDIVTLNNHLKFNLNDFLNKRDDIDVVHFLQQVIEANSQLPENKRTTILSQIYRNQGFEYNCVRHKKLFEEQHIIPKFCFSCYKIQIEPRNLKDLLLLYFVFNQSNFPLVANKKLMVEVREGVSGDYKGLFYIQNHISAEEGKLKLDQYLDGKVNLKDTSIKRGCSEYYPVFPNYNVSQDSKSSLNYDPMWEKIENKFDADYLNLNDVTSLKQYKGFSIHDSLIIENWLAYSLGNNDEWAQDNFQSNNYSKFPCFIIARERKLRL